MKKIYLSLLICIACLSTKATTFTVSIAGFAYTPTLTTCAIGDQVIIQAASLHPLNQVDASTWAANGSSTVTGGWGSKTTTHTFSATTTGTIYFVCQNHVLSGMKGMIVVNATGIQEKANNFLNQYNVFPNPATNSVKVSFGLNENSSVSIKLFNVLGQEVETLESYNGLNSGNHEFYFELPENITTGTYFVVISSDNRRSVKKLLVTK